jgi:hypothetical protein
MNKSLFLLSLVASLLVFTNCNTTGPTKAIVTATNENKVPMANVKVVIRAQSSQGNSVPANADLCDSAYTNSSGQVSFDFSKIYKDGQAGVAVLDIKGEYYPGADTLWGFSYVQLEAGVSKPATVVLRKYTKKTV